MEFKPGLTDEELTRMVEISREAKARMDKTPRSTLSKIVGGLGLIGIGVGIWMIWHADIWWTLGVLYSSFLVLFIGGWIAPKDPPEVLNDRRFHRLGAECIAPTELRALLGEEIAYDPRGKLPDALVRQAQVYVRNYHHYRGDQLVRCRYRGTDLEMGYVHLTDRDHRFRTDIELFEGFCLAAKTGIPFPAEIRVIQNYLSLFHVTKDVPDAEDFDAMFHGTGLQYLPPELRGKLAAISREGPGALGIWLRPDGQVFVASNGLWPICREDRPPEEWRKKYRRALQQPLEVLDCLLDL